MAPEEDKNKISDETFAVTLKASLYDLDIDINDLQAEFQKVHKEFQVKLAQKQKSYQATLTILKKLNTSSKESTPETPKEQNTEDVK